MHTLIRSIGKRLIHVLGSNYAFKPTADQALGFDRDASRRGGLTRR